MKIEAGKRYRTRGGDVVHVLCTDAPGKNQPVVGYFSDGSTGNWCASGEYLDPRRIDARDLISEVRESARVPREWIIGRNGGTNWIDEGPCLLKGETVRVREILDDDASCKNV